MIIKIVNTQNRKGKKLNINKIIQHQSEFIRNIKKVIRLLAEVLEFVVRGRNVSEMLTGFQVL